MNTLPDFPVDDLTLELIEDSLKGSFVVDDDGNHVLVGGDFTFSQLLDFFSGYDPANVETADGDIDTHQCQIYHYTDVIQAMINEIRVLRKRLND